MTSPHGHEIATGSFHRLPRHPSSPARAASQGERKVKNEYKPSLLFCQRCRGGFGHYSNKVAEGKPLVPLRQLSWTRSGQRFVSRNIFVCKRTNAQTGSKVLSWKRDDFQLDYRTSVCLTMFRFLIKGRVLTKYSIRFDKAKMEKWEKMEVQRKFCRPRVILKWISCSERNINLGFSYFCITNSWKCRWAPDSPCPRKVLSESVFPERFMLDHNLKMKFYILLLIQNLAFVYNKVAFFPDFRWASKDFAFQFSTLVLALPTERVVSFGRMKVFLGRRVAPTVELIPVMPSLRHRHYIKVPFCSRFPGHASGRLFCEYCNWVL